MSGRGASALRCRPGWRISLTLAAWLGVWCPPLAAETLEQSLIAAYLANPELEAGRAQQRANDELVPQALGDWRPRLFANTGIQRNAGRSSVGDLDLTTRASSLTLSQSLYAGGGTVAATSRAENLVSAGRADLVALEQAILLDAVDAYVAAWRDRAVLELARVNQQRLERQLQATRDRFEVGELARTDVAQAEARLSRAISDVTQAGAALAGADASFLQVIGREPRDLADPVRLRGLPASVAEAQAIAEANPNVTAASFRLLAARDDVDVAFADLLPSLDLEGRLQYADDPQTTVDWSRSASIGLNLSVPLYQGGAEYSRVRQSRQTVQQRRQNLEAAHRGVQAAVATAWDNLLAATAAIRSFEDEVRANEIAVEGVEQEAQAGLRTTLDVLDAQQELFTSQVNLVRARAVEVVASYQLKSAIGELTVADLALPVEPYDPLLHYARTRNRLFGIDDRPG
ncbi:MAG TPA: TolC family outer membrane protein [Geminicoccaceae bacterium]|nr:TolC family outer membrane protein [Geminicoccaceae bacterium]